MCIKNTSLMVGLWGAWVFFLSLPGAYADSTVPQLNFSEATMQAPANGKFEVSIHKSGIVLLRRPASRISVANPGIADILMLRDEQIYVVGKALGATNVMAWDKNNRIIASFDVEVTHDLDSLKEKLYRLLPAERIGINSAQENIILSGEVSSIVKARAAEDIASAFLAECIPSESNIVVRDTTGDEPLVDQQGGGGTGGGKQACQEGRVVNLLQVGGAQQIMLEIKVAEVAREVTKELESELQFINFGDDAQVGLVSGGTSFPNAFDAEGLELPIFGALDGAAAAVGPVVDRIEPNTPSIGSTGAFVNHLSGDFLFRWILDIARTNNLAKILAEPTLTTLTGQTAEFLSGGEFPIPVPQGGANNAITVEFKQFGVEVKFVPVVLDSGNINLKLNVSVSELAADNILQLQFEGTSSTFTVPSLTKRSAITTVELADGQTIGVAGLIDDNVREFVTKFPGLGDLPVLGTLFRSQQFISGQTELVMFVTPHLARPISRALARLPTDSFVPPSDLEFYLMGKMEAKHAEQPSASLKGDQGGVEKADKFGHEL